MYLEMTKQKDEEMVDRWQKDAKGIFIFVNYPVSFHTAVAVQRLT
jgi:hypothetical protein